MKKIPTLLILVCCAVVGYAQEISKNVKSFDRIVISPRINVILQKGDEPHVRMVYKRVNADKINIEVSGKTLHLYLEDARITEKMEPNGWNSKQGLYRDVNITAYVTYRDLEYIEIRGDQELTCHDPIRSETFTVKAYGENEITFASLHTGYFKISMYGENKLKIKEGKTEFQKYRLYGDNRIDTRGLRSYSAVANIYGESQLKLNTHDELRVSAFGESHVMYAGNPHVEKRIMIGQSQITRLE